MIDAAMVTGDSRGGAREWNETRYMGWRTVMREDFERLFELTILR